MRVRPIDSVSALLGPWSDVRCFLLVTLKNGVTSKKEKQRTSDKHTTNNTRFT
jgi:hypothetical protein